jgi:hypothetical protein
MAFMRHGGAGGTRCERLTRVRVYLVQPLDWRATFGEAVPLEVDGQPEGIEGCGNNGRVCFFGYQADDNLTCGPKDAEQRAVGPQAGDAAGVHVEHPYDSIRSDIEIEWVKELAGPLATSP